MKMNQLKNIEIAQQMSDRAFCLDEQLMKIYENINQKTKRITKHLRFISIIVSCHPIGLLFALMTFFVYVCSQFFHL